MIGGESFVNVIRQIFQLSMVENLNYTKDDIDNMYPYERYVYFDLLEEFNEEVNKKRKEMEDNEN